MERYTSLQALSHPWIKTDSNCIPLTYIEEQALYQLEDSMHSLMRGLFFIALKSKCSIQKFISTPKNTLKTEEKQVYIRSPSTMKSGRDVCSNILSFEDYIKSSSPRIILAKSTKKDATRTPFNPRIESTLARAGMSTLQTYEPYKGDSNISPLRNTRNAVLLSKKSKLNPSPCKITLNVCKKA